MLLLARLGVEMLSGRWDGVCVRVLPLWAEQDAPVCDVLCKQHNLQQPVLLFWLKHRLDHQKTYPFSLLKKSFLDQRFQYIFLLILKTEALAETVVFRSDVFWADISYRSL